MVTIFYFACGLFLGGAIAYIFQTQQRINAYDRHREWCDREWEEHWTNEADYQKRSKWVEQNLLYREGWINGMTMRTDGPVEWRV